MWLETVTVRTSQLQALAAKVIDLVDALANTSHAPEVAVYLRHPPTSDLSIHLLWQSHPESADQCGIQIASALMEFGVVDHAVWKGLASSKDPTQTGQ